VNISQLQLRNEKFDDNNNNNNNNLFLYHEFAGTTDIKSITETAEEYKKNTRIRNRK
jgi:hypothetical protein